MNAERRRHLGRTAALCAAAVAGMLGLAFAAPPLYDAFCRVTGFGGTTQVATAAPSAISDREIEVRFDTNVRDGATLEFAPTERTARVKLGETHVTFFTVTNTSDRVVDVIATYNVTPHKTGPFFRKLQCFCFDDMALQPGERMELPVVFFVDSEMAREPDTEEVRSVVLSYTFFPYEGRNALPPVPGAAASALGAAVGAR